MGFNSGFKGLKLLKVKAGTPPSFFFHR